MNSNQNFTNTTGVAQHLGKSVATVKRWKKRGFIPFHQTSKYAPVMFNKDIIDTWWASLHTPGKKRL